MSTCLRDPEPTGRHRPAALLLLLLGILAFVTPFPGCAGTAPAPVSSAGGDPTLGIEVGFGAAAVALTLAQADAIKAGDATACVAMAVARGGVDVARATWRTASAEASSPDGMFQPPPMTVNAVICLPLGAPAPIQPPSEAGTVASLVDLVGSSLTVAADVACKAEAKGASCVALRVTAAVLATAAETYSSTVAALVTAPEGVVTIPLPVIAYPLK